jgi:hypothetical protein
MILCSNPKKMLELGQRNWLQGELFADVVRRDLFTGRKSARWGFRFSRRLWRLETMFDERARRTSQKTLFQSAARGRKVS